MALSRFSRTRALVERCERKQLRAGTQARSVPPGILAHGYGDTEVLTGTERFWVAVAAVTFQNAIL